MIHFVGDYVMIYNSVFYSVHVIQFFIQNLKTEAFYSLVLYLIIFEKMFNIYNVSEVNSLTREYFLPLYRVWRSKNCCLFILINITNEVIQTKLAQVKRLNASRHWGLYNQRVNMCCFIIFYDHVLNPSCHTSSECRLAQGSC